MFEKLDYNNTRLTAGRYLDSYPHFNIPLTAEKFHRPKLTAGSFVSWKDGQVILFDGEPLGVLLASQDGTVNTVVTVGTEGVYTVLAEEGANLKIGDGIAIGVDGQIKKGDDTSLGFVIALEAKNTYLIRYKG
jgi:hypothetical protein